MREVLGTCTSMWAFLYMSDDGEVSGIVSYFGDVSSATSGDNAHAEFCK